MLMPKRAYYNENVRCYSNGKIERLNKPKSKYGKAGTWTEVGQDNPTSNGYLQIKINGKMMKWHRVVWTAFNGEIPDGLTINHKDEIKTNNALSNLELMTVGDNVRYGTKVERTSRANTNGKRSKSVIGIDIKTGKQVEFPSVREAQRNGFDSGAICRCLKGKQKLHKDYKWHYKEDYERMVK